MAAIPGLYRNLALSLESVASIGEDKASDYFVIAPRARLRLGQHVLAHASLAGYAVKGSTATPDYTLLLGVVDAW